MPDPLAQSTVRVVPWPDPVVEELGHDPRSPYVERYWLGVLGPTATWLVRRLADRLDAQPDGFDLDLDSLAAELGVGHRHGRNAPFLRTVDRCARFGILEVRPRALRVRRRLPPLTNHQLERLPLHLRRAHEDEVGGGDRPVEELRERARGFALSLLDQGWEPERTEAELHTRGLHPALAHEAVTWATAHHRRGLTTSEQVPPAA